MSWIQVNQTQTVEPAPPPATIQYRLSIEVVGAAQIEPQLFVFRTDTDQYLYVATVNDMKAYPPSKAQAQAEDSLFYRASSMTLVFSEQTVAATASTDIQARLARVNRDWGAVSASPFGGVETFIYDSEEL